MVPLAKVSTGPVTEMRFLRVATVAGAGEAIVSIVADVANVAELLSYGKESLTAGTRIPMDDTREIKANRSHYYRQI